MNELEKLNQIFALVNMSAFCEKYGLSYSFTRKVLKGERKLSEKFVHSAKLALLQYQADLMSGIGEL